MYTLLILLAFILPAASPVHEVPSGISEEVAGSIKTGNAGSVAKFFSSSVDLKVIDKEDIYSKAQAELILKGFFAKQPVKSFNIIHQGASKNGDKFAIGTYESTTGKKFRTYFLFKKEGTELKIQQLRFEIQDE